MKSIDVKMGAYNEYGVEYNKKDPKFKVADHITKPKYKNIFAKGYVPNWSEETSMIKKVKKILYHRHT